MFLWQKVPQVAQHVPRERPAPGQVFPVPDSAGAPPVGRTGMGFTLSSAQFPLGLLAFHTEHTEQTYRPQGWFPY